MTFALAILVALVGGQIDEAYAPLVNAIVILAILGLGFRLAFKILPPWVGQLVGDVLRLVGQALSFLLRLVTGIKGKK